MTETQKNNLWNARHAVIYKAELSALYHQKRERFFELWDKLSKAVALLGGSSALAKVASPESITYAAIAITAASALSLVFGFSERSKRHAELARGFRQTIVEIMAKGDYDFEEKDVNQWRSKVLQQEVTEPPALSTLVVMCQNELAMASGNKDHVVKVCFIRRLFANFFDMPISNS